MSTPSEFDEFSPTSRVETPPNILGNVNSSILNSSIGLARTSSERDKEATPPNKRMKISEPEEERPLSTSRTHYSTNIHTTERYHNNQTLESKRRHRSELNSKISTLKTKIQEEELQNYQFSQKLMQLRKQLAMTKDQIAELGDCEEMSLKSLKTKYEIQTKELKLKHEHKLNALKEETSTKAKEIIDENNSKFVIQRMELVSVKEDLIKQIKLQQQELRSKLIKLKEDHSKTLNQRKLAVEESIEQLKNEIKQIDEETNVKLNVDIISEQEKLKSLTTENTRLDSIYKQLQVKHSNKESEITLLLDTIESKQKTIQTMKLSFEVKSQEVKNYLQQTEEIHARLALEEPKRRLLHNKLQEIKGNIRVYCRVRPSSTDEKLASLDIPDGELNDVAKQELVISKEDQDHTGTYSNSYGLVNNPSNANCYKFSFDKIFPSDSSNENIFEELSQLIQSSLDGFNVCVFAYGQTGSGKTYTMSNPGNGMIPLSLNKIFEDITELESKGWKYSVEGQVIEIYNENIVDLLATNTGAAKHEIKHDDNECKTTITNTTTISIESQSQAESILERAIKNRSTASTKANDRSSRSHSVFILRLRGENVSNGLKSEGTLNLVDLAGSERLATSQAKGDRLKETQAINKSLSCLGDVIFALSQQQSSHSSISTQHIPYRNSKLTYLLKHSLGGNSKTLMFVNISPLQKNFNETVNSLRFATKVNSTKLPTSKPNSK
ncbi:P-loop containing nucleoside triphosphate hydrolase protein [Scheffersomyces xylosifermentans]|uniref:P-loop containing nucleoside triphosphate hydrolase protein n=1 Tax=Scheffersomyces xylosifermentans TaxID=1304137 RepID=UPI00315CB0A0